MKKTTFYDAGIGILIGLIIVCLIATAVSQKYLGDDNAVEEFAEEIIESKIGVDIDLSPSTPEGKK